MPSKLKFDPKDMDLLLSPERKRSLDTHRLLSTVPIMTHHWVADIGCGPGYLTVPLGKYLFDGKVFAFDVQQQMLDAAQQTLDTVHLTNVEVIKSKESKLPLEDSVLDGALMAFVLQEARYPRALLKDAVRCLKKSGWIAILEWHKRDTEDGPQIEQRIEENKMHDLIEDVGLRLRSTRDLNGSQYMVMATK